MWCCMLRRADICRVDLKRPLNRSMGFDCGLTIATVLSWHHGHVHAFWFMCSFNNTSVNTLTATGFVRQADARREHHNDLTLRKAWMLRYEWPVCVLREGLSEGSLYSTLFLCFYSCTLLWQFLLSSKVCQHLTQDYIGSTDLETWTSVDDFQVILWYRGESLIRGLIRTTFLCLYNINLLVCACTRVCACTCVCVRAYLWPPQRRTEPSCPGPKGLWLGFPSTWTPSVFPVQTATTVTVKCGLK